MKFIKIIGTLCTQQGMVPHGARPETLYLNSNHVLAINGSGSVIVPGGVNTINLGGTFYTHLKLDSSIKIEDLL